MSEKLAWPAALEQAQARIQELKAENGRLRTALADYGNYRHYGNYGNYGRYVPSLIEQDRGKQARRTLRQRGGGE